MAGDDADRKFTTIAPLDPNDPGLRDWLGKLGERERAAARAQQAAAQADAYKRARHPLSAPPSVRAFVDSVVPAQLTDVFDGGSAAFETAANRLTTGFAGYPPHVAYDEVYKANRDLLADYERDHPLRNTAARLVGGTAQDAVGFSVRHAPRRRARRSGRRWRRRWRRRSARG